MRSSFFIFIFLSMYLQAGPKSNLLDGIRLFEVGRIEESIAILEPLSETDGTASYYLGLIYDPEFNRTPFSKTFIAYDRENEKRTQKYYKKAAELGNVYAKFRLGAYYQSMLQRRQRWKTGEKLLRKAKKELLAPALNGDWRAKYMLARISRNKHELYANNAISAIENEAKKGDRQAQLYLGKSLSQWLCRTDVCRNYPKAFAWFLVSSAQGSYHAKQHLINLKKLMSEEELRAGIELADDYLARYLGLKHKKSVDVD